MWVDWYILICQSDEWVHVTLLSLEGSRDGQYGIILFLHADTVAFLSADIFLFFCWVSQE